MMSQLPENAVQKSRLYENLARRAEGSREQILKLAFKELTAETDIEEFLIAFCGGSINLETFEDITDRIIPLLDEQIPARQTWFKSMDQLEKANGSPT